MLLALVLKFSTGFSKDFRLLESGRAHPAVDGVREQAVYIGVLGVVPWFFAAVANIMQALGKIGLKSSFQEFLDWCADEMEVKRKVSYVLLPWSPGVDGHDFLLEMVVTVSPCIALDGAKG